MRIEMNAGEKKQFSQMGAEGPSASRQWHGKKSTRVLVSSDFSRKKAWPEPCVVTWGKTHRPQDGQETHSNAFCEFAINKLFNGGNRLFL